MNAGGATVAVILAAGRSTRMGAAGNKALLRLGGEPILVRATRPFSSHPAIDGVLVVAAEEEIPVCAEELGRAGIPKVRVVRGGDSRHASEWLAIRELRRRIEDGGVELIVIHDAARPLYRGERLDELLAAAREAGGAILATPVDPGEPLVRIEDGTPPWVLSTEGLWRAQTPQAFQARILLQAFGDAERDGFDGSDTSSTVERMGVDVRVVAGDPRNMKITYPEDLEVAETLLEEAPGPA